MNKQRPTKSPRHRWSLGHTFVLAAFFLTTYCGPVGSIDAIAASHAEIAGTPLVSSIPVPSFPGSYAIWGATGNDSRGHIWIGVSSKGMTIPSAHLFEFVPETDQLIDRGDVVSELKRVGLWREGQGQEKIHSRIVQASDGNLYFASMDEHGENEDGSKLPTWGSHLWRLKMPGMTWEHLLAAPQGLIAVATGDDYVYTLGYFGHVLYQLDIKSGKIRTVEVGSVGGHTTRNVLCDARGHVYVPRLTQHGDSKRPPLTTLVEFDTELREVGQTPLKHYLARDRTHGHGIVAFQVLADGSICFVTHTGFLYQIVLKEKDASDVRELGWIHPKGKSYTASLFTLDDDRTLYAQSRLFGMQQKYEWLEYDLVSGLAETFQFAVDEPLLPPLEQALLYGSMTKDLNRSFYVAGTFYGKRVPLFLRVTLGP
jgi:hypothetical protein